MKTLQFSSYPIAVPQHGGQLRVAAMKKALSEGGFETASIAAFDVAHYKDFLPLDIAIPDGYFAAYRNDRPWDLTLSSVVNNNPVLRRRLVDELVRENADVYIFEQPWLWPLVREVVKTNPELRRPVVFSSHNVEFSLLRGMLCKVSGGTLSGHDNLLVEYTYNLEKELCEASDLVVACTQNDHNFFCEQFKVKRAAVFPNGINPPSEISKGIASKYAKRYDGCKLAGFVGSAHPPNAEGFEAMCGDNLGYLPPDSRIAVIGGVCDLIYNRSRDNLFYALNDSRCDYLGRVPQKDLDAILARCDVIVLPILTGGGSNLKTAEALVSGKTILSTSLAFRGYDAFRDFPTVNIVDDPKEWRAKLRELLASDERPVLSESQRMQTESLLFKNILKEYPKLIFDLLKELGAK